MTEVNRDIFPALACIILAAGQGTRMKSDLPKVLHKIAHKPLVSHVVSACEKLNPEKLVVVVAPDMVAVQTTVAPHSCVIQSVARGTGDAAKQAEGVLKDFKGDVVVLFGDTPLITPDALRFMQKRRAETQASIVVSSFTPRDPAQNGRLHVDHEGNCLAIIEYSDATQEQRAIGLCNGGIMLFDSAHIWSLLKDVKPHNAKNEYYLTDCIALAREKGLLCVTAQMDDQCVFGINTRQQLAEAEALLQVRLRDSAMRDGVTFTDPLSVFLAADTKLGRDVVIGPHVVFGPNVEVGDHVEIRSFSHLEGVKVSKGATIGPFARLRPGTVIHEEAHIGNFVEIKNASIGKGAKVNHLSYIGDAEIGAKSNIGAGTITCNYDGFKKSKTIVGEGAFIGSNTSLVAPVEVEAGAIIGAGSAITHHVVRDALAVTRAKQTIIEGWAKKFRDKNSGHK